MAKESKHIKVQDYYKTNLTSDLISEGDLEIQVAVPPVNKQGFIIINPSNSSTREQCFYHDVIGNTIYVREENRFNPNEHYEDDIVQINDTSLIFNYITERTSTTFFVEKIGGLNVKIWGGPILDSNITKSVEDTELLLTDNTNNYIFYNYITGEVSYSTTEESAAGIIVAKVNVSSGVIGKIEYRNHSFNVFNSAGIEFKGAYDENTGYIANNLVIFGPTTYICLQACVGIEPTNQAYWGALINTDGMAKSKYDPDNKELDVYNRENHYGDVKGVTKTYELNSVGIKGRAYSLVNGKAELGGTNFIGICQHNGVVGDLVDFNGFYDENQSGLTPGAFYKYNETTGEIISGGTLFKARDENSIDFNIYGKIDINKYSNVSQLEKTDSILVSKSSGKSEKITINNLASSLWDYIPLGDFSISTAMQNITRGQAVYGGSQSYLANSLDFNKIDFSGIAFSNGLAGEKISLIKPGVIPISNGSVGDNLYLGPNGDISTSVTGIKVKIGSIISEQYGYLDKGILNKNVEFFDATEYTGNSCSVGAVVVFYSTPPIQTTGTYVVSLERNGSFSGRTSNISLRVNGVQKYLLGNSGDDSWKSSTFPVSLNQGDIVDFCTIGTTNSYCIYAGIRNIEFVSDFYIG